MTIERAVVLGPDGEIENVILIDTETVTKEWCDEALGSDRVLANADHIVSGNAKTKERLSKVEILEIPTSDKATIDAKRAALTGAGITLQGAS